MSQPGAPTGSASMNWQWDEARRQYYRYDIPSDRLVYQDGRSFPRPSNIPRSIFVPTTAQLPSAPNQKQYGSQSQGSYGSQYQGTYRAQSQSLAGQQGQTQFGSPPGQNVNYITAPGSGVSPPLVPQQGSRPSTSHFKPQETGRRDSRFDGNNLAEYMSGATIRSDVPPQLHGKATGSTSSQGNWQPNLNDVRIISGTDPANGVNTRIGIEPAWGITDPDLYRRGIHAKMMILGTGGAPGDEERLYSIYRIRKPSFFAVGRVFIVLWAEPAGETATAVTAMGGEWSDRVDRGLTQGRHGGHVFSKVRRFVVIREGYKYCSALPIVTNTSRGVGKPGTKKSEHAIIYTGKEVPQPLKCELPERDEDGMRPRAIQVDPDDRSDKLAPTSRLDFGKVHTIQHNIKVKAFGQVNPKSLPALLSQFENVFNHRPEPPSATHSSSHRAPATASTSSDTKKSGYTHQLPKANEKTQHSQRRPSIASQPRKMSQISQSSKGKAKAERRSISSSSSEDEKLKSKADPAKPRMPQNSQALQAQNIQNSVRNMIHQGHTRKSAIDVIARRFVEQGFSRQAAEELVLARLAHGHHNPAPAARNTDDSSEDDEESSEEESSSEEEGNRKRSPVRVGGGAVPRKG